MGYNDEIQTQGLFPLEEVGGRQVRWTGLEPQATLLVSPPFSGPGVLHIDGLAPPVGVGGPCRLDAEAGGRHFAWSIESDGRPFSVRSALDVTAGDQELRLTTSPLWAPRDHGLGDDARRLGVAIERVALEERSESDS